MALKGWDASFSVKVPAMDDDHKKLVDMISTLHEAMTKGRSREVLTPMIAQLQSYATEHFGREEKYMQETKMPDYELQKSQHKVFMDKVSEFQTTLNSGNVALAVTVLPFLNQWFLNHIMKMDMKYKP